MCERLLGLSQRPRVSAKLTDSRPYEITHVTTDQITVSVDPDVASAYRSTSEQERRKLDLLVNLRLRDATRSKASLKQIMRQISQNAQGRGLTPEILRSILDEE